MSHTIITSGTIALTDDSDTVAKHKTEEEDKIEKLL